MRRTRLLLIVLAAALLAVGCMADAALRHRAASERRAARATAREKARLTASAVRARLAQAEEAVAGGQALEDVEAWRICIPPRRSASLVAKPYEGRERQRLAELVASDLSTSSGLPVAVVAAVAMGRREALDGLAERLLSGELPVRAEDLGYLAEVIGAAGDPRVAELADRIRRAPAARGLPELPAYRRSVEAGGRLRAWARAGDRIEHFSVPTAALLPDAASAARAAIVDDSAPAASDRLRVDVPGIPGLRLEVPAGTAGSSSPWRERLLAWGGLLAAFALAAALARAVERETAAVARERSFLGAVTHELRTPLASVRVLGETLAEGRGEPREYGGLIAQESERLDALVDRVLAVTRLDQAPAFAALDPWSLVREAATLVRPRAERRRVALSLDLPEESAAVRWDAEAVRRALLGLVENALRHGCPRGGRIEIAGRVDGAAVRLSVRDDGPGIRRRDRPGLFDRFERRGATAGTGLGLYLVEQVARAHGGRVELDAAEQAGAHFTLVLPRVPPGAGEAAP